MHSIPPSIRGFQYPIILPSQTVHGVLKTRILKWFAIPFFSEPLLYNNASERKLGLTSKSNDESVRIDQMLDISSKHTVLGLSGNAVLERGVLTMTLRLLSLI